MLLSVNRSVKFELARTSILPVLPEADAPLDFAAQAEITRESVNQVEVRTVSSHSAWLVLNDSWAAGWTAAVDGAERPVAKVNYAFRGIVIPAGKHEVVFRYRPRLLLLGLRVSVAAFVLLICFWLYIGLREVKRVRSLRPAQPTLS